MTLSRLMLTASTHVFTPTCQRAADHESTIDKLEGQLADAMNTSSQLERDLTETSKTLDASRECTRLQVR